MRRYHEVLTSCRHSKVCGSHSVEFCRNTLLRPRYLDETTNTKVPMEKATRVFKYHGNTICVVNDDDKEFVLSHAGWFTSSTNVALNGYRYHFEHELGYKNLNKIPVFKYERKKA